ncbi:MAG: prolipoprotein diacylglyceryl transferase [Bacteroidales bacterium]
MQAYIHWAVDPTLISLGGLEIRYYGLFFATGFILGYFIMQKIFRHEGIPEKELDLLTTVVVIGTILGARLGHVIFYEPQYYLKNPAEILMIWHGGLASHGGAIGILLALLYYKRRSVKKSYLWILDRLAIPTALAGGFIRLGNLMNSEIVGAKTDVAWAFIFEQPWVDNAPRHPAQLYEALAYFATAAFLYFLYHHFKEKTPRGRILGWFFILVFSFRFIIEFFKANQVEFESTMSLNMGQWLSIPFVIAGIIILYRSFAPSNQIPDPVSQA